MHSFVIVIPSYNNKEYCEKNLLSALNQHYPAFRILYTDDCSTDGTPDEIQKIIDQNDCEHKVKLIKNLSRLGAMHNMYNMVHYCDNSEIIVVLDGDDWLSHPNVLTRLSCEYDKGAWITYGQFQESISGALGCSRSIPKHVIDTGSYRRFRWCSSHVRTYYAGLFKHINVQDMKIDDEWLKMSSDLAAMFPMLEMAGQRQSFIPDILYIYNTASPINDSKINLGLQQGLERKIRSMPRYQELLDF